MDYYTLRDMAISKLDFFSFTSGLERIYTSLSDSFLLFTN